jgi:hypothetical protein
LDGHLIPISVKPGSNTISRSLTPGIYIVKIQAGEKVFSEKIAVSR